MLDHLDHICQLAGNALHVGIGTDLDGAFGKGNRHTTWKPLPICKSYPALLKKRGYAQEDVENIMHGNWLRFLRRVW